ncbi:helix-turn-helix domain-containing protein [Deinococcus sp. HMF7604]|uniref:helix-turn-helix domain-containing protein n=1 Tax=Deinococcus betulae TaxID=2873312 RepID=UPI001CCDC15C|nr:helix-turn-helix domain-containing protein [Deinococcus betulae]
MAQASQMDWSYISQIERGKRNVGIDILDALAQAVGTSVINLLSPSEDEVSGHGRS